MIVVVAGTRPEAVKLAPVMWALRSLGVGFVFVWSGQHYDYEMSSVFFEELGLPEPDFDLDVRSGSHAEQTARIMVGVEDVLKRLDGGGVVVAEGDTNTVLGAGLAAVKYGWLFGHVEAGLRSFNRVMPEEVNRVVAGAVASVHFAPSIDAVVNLLYEGVVPWRIHLTGNTVVDAVHRVLPKIREYGEKVLSELSLSGDFGVVTLHRAENVDDPVRLGRILSALIEVSRDLELVFPVHPRTRRRLTEFNLWRMLEESGIKVVKPLGYFEFLGLLSRARVVFTDSGGVQEEALVLAVPCITLRYNTERPETVWVGGNILVGDDPERITKAARYVLEHGEEIAKRLRSIENPYGDGKAGERIARVLKGIVEDKETYNRYAYKEPDYRDLGDPTYVLVDGNVFAGLAVEDFHRRYPGLMITLIYNEEGKPVVPFPDRIIERGWKLRIWGPRKILESFLGG